MKSGAVSPNASFSVYPLRSEEGIPSSSSAQCSKSNNNLGIMCTAEAQQRQGVWYV
jgi:hypothetical protein